MILSTTAAFRARCESLRREGPLGLVPTMGYLHAGHVSLIAAARARCKNVVVSIFVNPAQFAPTDDLARYPRDLDGDVDKCRKAGAALVFAPPVDELYPPAFQSYVEPGALAAPLEGERRPGHFRGVCTVVAKLFTLTRADAAFFGEKDYQQLRVVTQMARDLDLGTEVVPCPVVREPDGLAMSSRNVYLSPDERQRAVSISQGLRAAQAKFTLGETTSQALVAACEAPIRDAGLRIDYVALADPRTMLPPERVAADTRVLVAAFNGRTRLIDNAALGIPLRPL